jgi:hypothetical protein
MTRVLIPRSDNRNAKKIQTSDFEKYFDFVLDHIASGFCMSVGTGLAVNVSAGTGRLNGLYIEGTSTDEVTCLLPCDGNYVYVTMCNDPNGEPQAWKFTSNITGVTPACSTPLGIATTNSTGVTAVDNVTGRATMSGLGGPQFNETTSAGTFTPSKQTGLTQIIVDASCLTNGDVLVNVDGSLCSAYGEGCGVSTKIVNPTASLTIVSTDKGYDLSSASYDSKSKSLSTYFRGMYFRSDGLKWYSIGYDGLREYDMACAWDVSTSSTNDTFCTRPTTEYAESVWFKPDGTKAFMSETAAGGAIRELAFTTAWDVSTASYSGNNYTPSGSKTVKSLYVKPDGTKYYALLSCEDVQEYSMSTPWDITTSSLLNSYSTTSQDSNPEGIDFKSTGSKYYIVGKTGDKVYEYTMSTPWDISTSSYTSTEFSVSSQTTDPCSVRFGDSGSKMYVMRKDVKVFQYSSTSSYAGTVRSSVQ